MLGVPALQCANALLGDDNNETMTGTVHAGPQLINVAVLIRKMCDSEDTKIQHTWSIAAVSHIFIYITSDCTSSSRQAHTHHTEQDRQAGQDLGSDVISLVRSQDHPLEHVGRGERYKLLLCSASLQTTAPVSQLHRHSSLIPPRSRTHYHSPDLP